MSMIHGRRLALGVLGFALFMLTLAIIGLVMRMSPLALVIIVSALMLYPIGMLVEENLEDRHG